MGEQRVPLLLIESDGESTELIHRYTPFSDTLKLRLLPLARRPSSSAIRAAICSGVRFVSLAIVLSSHLLSADAASTWTPRVRKSIALCVRSLSPSPPSSSARLGEGIR